MTLFKGLTETMTKVPVTQIRPGDILLFRAGDHLTHLAVVTEPGVVIQSVNGKGVVEHRLVDRPHSAYRVT